MAFLLNARRGVDAYRLAYLLSKHRGLLTEAQPGRGNYSATAITRTNRDIIVPDIEQSTR
jgi:hypothetical protein